MGRRDFFVASGHPRYLVVAARHWKVGRLRRLRLGSCYHHGHLLVLDPAKVACLLRYRSTQDDHVTIPQHRATSVFAMAAATENVNLAHVGHNRLV